MGPNKSLSTCAAPGNAVTIRSWASAANQAATHRAAARTRRPARTTAYSVEKPRAYRPSPTVCTIGVARIFWETLFIWCCVFRRNRCLRSRCTHCSRAQSERSFSPRWAVGLGADGISCCGSVVFSSSKKGCSFRIPVSFQSVKPRRKVSKRHSTSVYLSFIIHSARTETSIITEFGGSFHGLFTKYTNSRVSIRQKGL